MSLFDSLTIARSGVLSHQQRLSVISHNIANVNTPGYHRQTAVLGVNPPNNPTLYTTRNYTLGSGVRVMDVVRSFNDATYRAILNESSSGERHAALAGALSELETLVNASGDSSLSESMRLFWTAWQDVSAHPENLAMRSILLERAGAMAQAFQSLDTRLTNFRNEIAAGTPPDCTGTVANLVNEVNDLATRIQDLNRRITAATGLGTTANDLMDQRDLLIEELSQKTNITLTLNGTVMIDGQVLVTGDGTVRNELEMTGSGPITFSLDSNPVNISEGSIAGWVDAATAAETVLGSLDTMAFELIGAVNALHSAGYDLDGNTGIDFFTGTDCATIAVNGAMYDPSNPLLSNPRMVAAAASLFDAGPPAIPNTGDGANALALADLAYAKIAGLNNQSFGDNLTTLSVSLGAAALSERERAGDGEAVLNMLKNSMQSETGVSMDEELVDLVSAQRAYQSAARLVTTIDEMLDTVINRMA